MKIYDSSFISQHEKEFSRKNNGHTINVNNGVKTNVKISKFNKLKYHQLHIEFKAWHLSD